MKYTNTNEVYHHTVCYRTKDKGAAFLQAREKLKELDEIDPYKGNVCMIYHHIR